MKKWIVLFAGVVIQTILGGVYAWSAFVPSLKTNYGLSNGQCGFIFGVLIAVFTLAMIPAGRLLKKYGPRIIAIIGSLLFMAGYSLASFSGGNFYILLLSLSVFTGAGIGFGYVVPLTVGMKWFPNNKGLVTGLAVAGFGGGALLLSSIVEHLVNTVGWNILQIFLFVGVVLGSVAFISSLFMSEPKKANQEITNDTAKIKLKPYLQSESFWYICLGMFGGTFAGLLTISNLKPMALSFGMKPESAVWMISFFAFGNALGRIKWGQIHDKIGSWKTITLSLLFLGLTLLPFLFKLPAIVILSTAFCCGLGFGACFVVYASSIVQRYGVEVFPNLYPICFLGYGLAGLTGPSIGGWIIDTTGSYSSAVILSISVVILSLILIIFGLDKNYCEDCNNLAKST